MLNDRSLNFHPGRKLSWLVKHHSSDLTAPVLEKKKKKNLDYERMLAVDYALVSIGYLVHHRLTVRSFWVASRFVL